MKQLWAPWRMDYIQDDHRTEGKGCIFCVRETGPEDVQRLILHRGEHAFVMMNRFPYTNGHLMVVPYRHTCDLDALGDVEVLEMHRLLGASQQVLSEYMNPQGFNIGVNLGQAGGAGVTDHLHTHLVPRWSGDTNFMPVFSEVRVIPQHLEETYHLLAAAFAKRFS